MMPFSPVFAFASVLAACSLLSGGPRPAAGLVRTMENMLVLQAQDALSANASLFSATQVAQETVQDVLEGLDARKGKVFFLFLAGDRLPNADIWMKFFEGQEVGKTFEVLLHCVNLESCKRDLGNETIFRTIPTVHSDWCVDLVSAMDALLAAALGLSGGHDGDKFVFVSDSTVPVKSFNAVRQKLITDDRGMSNFCILSPSRWALQYDGEGRPQTVKHHQWMVLSRAHASKIVGQRWKDRNLLSELFAGQVLGSRALSIMARTLAEPLPTPLQPKVDGCLDEYLYFKLLFGFVNGSSIPEWPLEGLGGSPVRPTANLMQGQCDTFALFGYEGGNFTSVLSQLEAAPDTIVEESPRGLIFRRRLHPVRFNRLSEESLGVLRGSPFLFARKIDSKTTFASGGSLADAFQKYIFLESD